MSGLDAIRARADTLRNTRRATLGNHSSAAEMAYEEADTEFIAHAREDVAALLQLVTELQEALREIAAYDSHNDGSGCRCGHRMSMCHAVNAATYCGGHPGAALARHALGECPPVCFVCLARSSGGTAA